MASRERTANRPAADGTIHDQEVLRARRELAAYFKGRRTEREARSALKIIKAFVREREKTDSSKRRPLPGMKAARAPRRKPRPARSRKLRPIEATSAAEPSAE